VVATVTGALMAGRTDDTTATAVAARRLR
jgi:hypothetical protein